MFTLTHTIEGIKVNVHVYKLIITMLLQLQGERERNRIHNSMRMCFTCSLYAGEHIIVHVQDASNTLRLCSRCMCTFVFICWLTLCVSVWNFLFSQ